MIYKLYSLHCKILLLGTRNIQGSVTKQRSKFPHHYYILICVYKCFAPLTELSHDILTTALIIFVLRFTIFWAYSSKILLLGPHNDHGSITNQESGTHIIIKSVMHTQVVLKHLPGYHVMYSPQYINFWCWYLPCLESTLLDLVVEYTQCLRLNNQSWNHVSTSIIHSYMCIQIFYSTSQALTWCNHHRTDHISCWDFLRFESTLPNHVDRYP